MIFPWLIAWFLIKLKIKNDIILIKKIIENKLNELWLDVPPANRVIYHPKILTPSNQVIFPLFFGTHPCLGIKLQGSRVDPLG